MKKIKDFFYAPLPSATLGAFRILVACFAMAQAFVLLPDWAWLYGQNGIIPWVISDALSFTGTPALSAVANQLAKLGLSPDQSLKIITVAYFISLAALIAGYKTRIAAILSWLLHLLFTTTGHFTAYGVETFTHIALFYCMVLPVGIVMSVDAIKNKPVVPAYLVTLGIRVLQLHLCIMYLSSGIEKGLGAQWWNGEAIWIAMQQDQFHQADIGWMASYTFIPKILCWGTLITETFYPLGIYWKKSRKIWLAAIISMHLGIAVFLGLHLFGALMIILNLTIFGEQCFPGMFSNQLSAGSCQLSAIRKKEEGKRKEIYSEQLSDVRCENSEMRSVNPDT